MESTLAPQTGRLDRHIRRSVLSVSEGVSRHRVAYSLEEALRLASLPGEEEGRIYCFRRVSLSGISAEANRRLWTDQVQRVLGALAAQAVHANDLSAGSVNAVYFNNLEEALEALLRRAVLAHNSSQCATPEWFSNSLLGRAPESSYALQIPTILERLRPSSMAPGAAAAILFAALGGSDPVGLLSAISSSTIREWLNELEGQKAHSSSAPPIQLPHDIKTSLQRTATHFGWKDPATVWLAAQAVLYVLPGAWSSGTSVKRARATLRVLEEEQLSELRDRDAPTNRESVSRIFISDDDERAAASLTSIEKKVAEFALQDGVQWTQARKAISGEDAEVPGCDQAHAFSELSAGVATAPSIIPDVPMAKPSLLGEATKAAGLYFLLNVLRSLAIAAAVESCPTLAESNLATHILRQLAMGTGVPEDDPILLGLRISKEPYRLSAEALKELSFQPGAWPKGFTVSYPATLGSGYFLRVWIVAVKRWLWQTGRLTVSEVINRNGRVWLTRTDLDVTFPLAAADLRIRRIGLDIDPGWLPWFGETGRVVRFHYRDRDPERSPC